MSIYNSPQPFTYLIGWRSLNKWYYGVRYSHNCHPSDLWVTYFTSSKKIKEFRLLNGEPDVIEVRKIFVTRQQALSWEGRVLKSLWKHRTHWLNKKFGETKFVPTIESVQKNIQSKRNRTPEYQRQVEENISNGAKKGHLAMSDATKIRRKENIAKRNKHRSPDVNLRISEKIKQIHANTTAEQYQLIEEKKKLTREKNKQLGITRKVRSHVTLCSCLCCRKIMNLGCFGNHNKKKAT